VRNSSGQQALCEGLRQETEQANELREQAASAAQVSIQEIKNYAVALERGR
jgi:hypothetical protein